MKHKERYRKKQHLKEADEARLMLNFERKFWSDFNLFLFADGKGNFVLFERLWRITCFSFQKKFRYVKPDPMWFFKNMVCHWN